MVDRLVEHRTLGAAPREELAWIVAHSRPRKLAVGELLSSRHRPVDGLHIVLSGLVTIHVDRGAGSRRVMEWRGGDVTGVLPYSRVKNPPGDAVVEEPTEVISVARDLLPDFIKHCYCATAILVHVMMDRARQFTASDFQDEKMVSLGRLAAGLAHELNNPASAASRSATRLVESLEATETAARTLARAQLSDEQFAALDAVRSACLAAKSDTPLSAVALADREDAITTWLEARGLDAVMAEPLANTPVTMDELDRLARAFAGDSLGAAVSWVACGCTGRSLLHTIEAATARIHDLVKAVKSFSYMDRGSVPEAVDIARGLRDTVAVLEGKAHQKQVIVAVDAEQGLPSIYAFGGEVNQIWEKIIDNAIDAAPAGGHVAVTAAKRGATIHVTIVDDGGGIAPEIMPRIFDPFFTTKPVGQGIGLGLDIAKRLVRWHNGEINVNSHPGRTEFSVSLPLTGAKTG
jgi:signal transduction histidine kinase